MNDVLVWAESQANTGLTNIVGVGPTGVGYAVSGDTITLKDLARPFLNGFGCTGVTKPQASAIIPTNGNGGKGYYGPGAVNFVPLGWLDLQKNRIAIELYKNDVLTGQTSNTAVNEDSLLAAVISYGAPLPPVDLSRFQNMKRYAELATITSAGAVTYNSGVVTVHAACTNTTNWYDPNGVYYLLGVSGALGVAEGGGIVHVTNLPGPWAGYVPGVQLNGLNPVNFSTQQPFTPFAEPIGPLSGENLKNSVSLGMTQLGAAAQTFVLHMARQR